jgi:hypothetical protein
MVKRRVFVSYHHGGDQYAVDAFIRQFADGFEVFSDSSLERAADSDDVDYLARVCREGIDGTSTTIVILGQQTGCRKFVDWEIRHTLEREHGLLGILRPGVSLSAACVPPRLADNSYNAPAGREYAALHGYPNSPYELQRWIEEAVAAPKWKINNSRAKLARNCTCTNGFPGG